MDKDFNAIIVNKDIFTIDDAREAAKQLFEVQVDDFSELKNEKWYKHLLNAITFGADGKKKVIKNIRSLSKLQTIFMKVYCENYKGLDAQLNEIIDNLSKTNESVKKLYINYILGIRPQHSVLELSVSEQDILLLLLCSYLSNGDNEENLKKYRGSVAKKIGRGLPQRDFKPEMLETVKSGEIFYRCIVEMCAIDGGLDDFSVPDNIYEAIEYISISSKTKREIEKNVYDELNAFGLDYLVAKYGVAENEILGDDIEMVEESEIKEENLDKGDVELSEENITSILQIKKGENKVYINKKVHISTYINCEGNLEFNNCIIYYNETDARNEITIKKGGNISISNSIVVCMGFDENPFIICKEDNKVFIENTSFIDCSYFLKMKDGYSFTIKNCKMENCLDKFLDIYIKNSGTADIRNNVIEQKDVSEIYFTDLEKIFKHSLISVSAYGDKNIMFSENVIYEEDAFQKIISKLDRYYGGFKYIDAMGMIIQNCSFHGLSSGMVVSSIRECKFENCTKYIVLEKDWIDFVDPVVDNCVFINCTNVIKADDNTKITNCQFVSCYDKIITAKSYWGGICVEFCQFNNIKNLPSNNCIEGLEQEGSSIIFKRAKDSKSNANYLKKCIFDGISINKNFLIAASGYEKPYGIVTYIEECDFKNCTTKRSSGKIIKEYTYYDSLFKKEQAFHANIITNCRGLDKINKEESSQNENIEIKIVSTNGNQIGSTIAKCATGVAAFAAGGPVALAAVVAASAVNEIRKKI